MSHKQAKRLRKSGVVKSKRPADMYIGDYTAQADKFSAMFGLKMGLSINRALQSLRNHIDKHLGVSSKTYQPNGSKECQRRQRQINKGMLTAS